MLAFSVFAVIALAALWIKCVGEGAGETIFKIALALTALTWVIALLTGLGPNHY